MALSFEEAMSEYSGEEEKKKPVDPFETAMEEHFAEAKTSDGMPSPEPLVEQPGILEKAVSPISAISTIVKEPITTTKAFGSDIGEYAKNLSTLEFGKLAEMARRDPGYGKVLEKAGVPEQVPVGMPSYASQMQAPVMQSRESVGKQLDIVAPEQMAVGYGVGKIAKGLSKFLSIPEWLTNYESKNISKVMARTAKDSDNINPLVLGRRLATGEKSMPITNPMKMVDELVGPEIVEQVNTPYGAKITAKRIGKGKIGEMSKDVDDILVNSSNNGNLITKQDIKDRIIQDHPPLSSEMNVESEDLQKTLQFIDRNDVFPWKELDLKSANDLKRNINAHIPSKAYGQPLDKAVSESIEQKRRIAEAIKGLISDRLSPDEALNFNVKNNILHDNLDLLKVYDAKYYDNLKRIGVIDATISSALGFAGGQMMGHGGYGAAVGAFSPAMQMAREASKTGIPAAKASLARGARQAINIAPQVGAAGAPLITPNPEQSNQGRTPQSIDDFEIPRETTKVLELAPAVASKLAQIDPKLADQFMHIAQKRPEQMTQFMAMQSNIVPEMFEHDEYGRMDGAIRRDLVPLYVTDVLKDPSLSETDRAKILNDVSKSNRSFYTPRKP